MVNYFKQFWEFFHATLLLLLYTHYLYYNVIALSDGLPLGTGGSLQKSYEITPLLKDNRVSKCAHIV